MCGGDQGADGAGRAAGVGRWGIVGLENLSGHITWPEVHELARSAGIEFL